MSGLFRVPPELVRNIAVETPFLIPFTSIDQIAPSTPAEKHILSCAVKSGLLVDLGGGDYGYGWPRMPHLYLFAAFINENQPLAPKGQQ